MLCVAGPHQESCEAVPWEDVSVLAYIYLHDSISLRTLCIFRMAAMLKWGALSLKSSVLKKTHILTPFNVKIATNYAFLFINKENKILLGPPPPKKKAMGYERSLYGYTDNSCGYTHCVDLLGIAQCVYSKLHAQVFLHNSRP